jgi:hypothetical protein
LSSVPRRPSSSLTLKTGVAPPFMTYHSSKLMVACWSSVTELGQIFWTQTSSMAQGSATSRKKLGHENRGPKDLPIAGPKYRSDGVAQAYCIDILVSRNRDLVWSTSLRVSLSTQHLPLPPMALVLLFPPPNAALHGLRQRSDVRRVLMSRPKIRYVFVAYRQH